MWRNPWDEINDRAGWEESCQLGSDIMTFLILGTGKRNVVQEATLSSNLIDHPAGR